MSLLLRVSTMLRASPLLQSVLAPTALRTTPSSRRPVTVSAKAAPAKAEVSKVVVVSKSELVEQVAKKQELSEKEVSRVVNATLEEISNYLVAGDKVQLIGFGTFEQKARAARKGRNPATGADLDIPASKYASFKPSSKFKERLNAK